MDAAEYLVRTARVKRDTACWPIAPGRSTYVGFSHGAAGIGYFLLHAARVTGNKVYGTLAAQAARYVISVAEPEGSDGWHWWRTDPPQRKEWKRIQWCHGAPGTGLFFLELYRLRRTHAAALDRCVATTKRLGRTARRSGCQCHGVSGNAELLIEAFQRTGKSKHWVSAREFGASLLRWENGTYKVAGVYSASYMTGWAGIGHFFLRLAHPRDTPLPMMVAPQRF